MAIEADNLIERRRLRRRLSIWRIAALVAVAAAVLGFFASLSGMVPAFGRSEQIARVRVSGMITDDREQLKLLQRIEKANHVSAVLIDVDSPGGTTTGGESLYQAIRSISARKPVVAVFGTMATSAAYITGLACDYIVARGNTVTGSVGVIFQWPEVTQLLDKLGIKYNEIKSGALKAVPSMFQPLDNEGRRLTEEMVAESHRWFLGLVADRRKLDPQSIPGLVQGRIFSGRQAVTLKLVDALGSEREAVSWLEKTRGIKPGLRIVEWKKSSSSTLSAVPGLRQAVAALLGGSAGLVADRIADSPVLQRLTLDGLVSVWHGTEN